MNWVLPLLIHENFVFVFLCGIWQSLVIGFHLHAYVILYSI